MRTGSVHTDLIKRGARLTGVKIMIAGLPVSAGYALGVCPNPVLRANMALTLSILSCTLGRTL